MPIDVLMPPLSQTLDTMVLVEWLKQPGDPVQKGEPLFLVESDKATLEVESPATGTLVALLAEAGAEVPVKSRIGVIAAPGETYDFNARAQGTQGRKEQQQQEGQDLPGTEEVVSGRDSAGERIPLPPERSGRILASPRARQAAAMHEVTLQQVTATGPQGLIVERDVLAALTAREPRSQPPRVTPVAARAAERLAVDPSSLTSRSGERITRADVEAAAESRPSAGVALDSTRRTIARRLHDAHLASVPVTLTRECDATELVMVRERILASLGEAQPRPSYTDFFAMIVARCLHDHPQMNGTFDGERLVRSQSVHLALAVETERGLLAPVIRDCQRLGLLEVAREREKLADAARANRLAPDAPGGGTFTLTNLGPLRVDAFTPVINPPQIAILGVGRIRPAPAVHEGHVAVRQLLVLSLTFDHRVVDGAPAARLLDDIAALVEHPERLWLLAG